MNSQEFLTTAVLAALVLASGAGLGPAAAETTTLICNLHDDLWTENQPTTIDLNDAQSTVAIHFGGVHAPGGGAMGAVTYDSVPATFGDQEIRFQWQGTGGAPASVINRMTGSLTAFQPGLGTAHYTCQAAHKQF